MEIHWPLILFTFFLSLSTGIVFGQGLLTVLRKGKETQMIALIASFITLVIGGIAVFLHLQHWERIFNGFGHITSGITLEFIGCIVFVVALALYWLMMRRSDDETAPRWCGWMFMVVAAALMVVVGDSYLMPSVPAWDSPLLPVYYVCNMLALGAFATLLIALYKKTDVAMPIIKKFLLVGTIAQIAAVLVYAILITANGSLYVDLGYYFDPTLPDVAMVDAAWIVNLFAGESAIWFWLLVLIVGCAAPLAAAVLIYKGKDKGKTFELAIGSLVCVVIGGVAWRVILYVVAIHLFAVY